MGGVRREQIVLMSRKFFLHLKIVDIFVPLRDIFNYCEDKGSNGLLF